MTLLQRWKHLIFMVPNSKNRGDDFVRAFNILLLFFQRFLSLANSIKPCA